MLTLSAERTSLVGLLAVALLGCGSSASTAGTSSGAGGAAASSGTSGTSGTGGMSSASSASSGTGGAASSSSSASGGQACVTASTCPGMDSECQQRTCVGGQCGVKNAPSGTKIAAQAVGDCKVSVCDGNGAVLVLADPTDAFDDGKDCTYDACNGMTPANPPVSAGMPCGQNGGALCDGLGSCVECLIDKDCQGGAICKQHQCVASGCNDGLKDGNETDVDCGGACPACPVGKMCQTGGDCQTGICTAGVCAVATCNDGLKNGQETDVDCGGPTCVKCAAGKGCGSPGDCQSSVCVGGVCQAPSCTDGVKNGKETGIDCGGGACVGCPLGAACQDPGDCQTSACMGNVCVASCPATNGMMGGESANIIQSCVIPPVPAANSVNVAMDVTYTSPGGTPVMLDVAWPLGPGLHPLVVFIHGGSWYGGTKALHTNDMLLLAGQGYTASSIDYRSTKFGYTFPAEEADTRCAIRWLRKNAATYNIDPARIAVIGVSAGGHLAAQLGAQSEDGALDDGTCVTPGNPRPNVVIGYYGIYDLTSSAGLGSVAQKAAMFLGATPEADPVKAAEASPILHLDTCDPPFLLNVGTADSVVPPQQTYAMKAAVRNADVPATAVVIPGADHAYPVFGGGLYAPAACTTLDFLLNKLVP